MRRAAFVSLFLAAAATAQERRAATFPVGKDTTAARHTATKLGRTACVSACQCQSSRSRQRLAYNRCMPPSNLPPGPRSPAFWQLLSYSHDPLGFFERHARRYGTPFTVRWTHYGTAVMLTDGESIRDVFRGDPHALHSGEANAFLNVSLGKNSVLVLDEEAHARQRRVLVPPLKGERMRAFFDAMRSATREEIRSWPRGKVLTMLPAMRRITLRVISQAVLGLHEGPELLELEHKIERVLVAGRMS